MKKILTCFLYCVVVQFVCAETLEVNVSTDAPMMRKGNYLRIEN